MLVRLIAIEDTHLAVRILKLPGEVLESVWRVVKSIKLNIGLRGVLRRYSFGEWIVIIWWGMCMGWMIWYGITQSEVQHAWEYVIALLP